MKIAKPYKLLKGIMEALADYEDLRELRDAKAAEGHLPSIPLSDVRKQLGI